MPRLVVDMAITHFSTTCALHDIPGSAQARLPQSASENFLDTTLGRERFSQADLEGCCCPVWLDKKLSEPLGHPKVALGAFLVLLKVYGVNYDVLDLDEDSREASKRS